MTKEKIILVSNLGKCEHCGAIIAISDNQVNIESSAKPKTCPHCQQTLTEKSFGFDKVSLQRTHWIGPDSNWTQTRPKKNFILGDYYICIGQIKTRFYAKS
ncbi:MAG: hypothetical protein WCP93_04225 [Candidatus Berkelbacteria bacterium]